MFRFRKNLKVSYQKQGYIHFVTRQYYKLKKEERAEIDELFRLAGGEYFEALKRIMTTDVSIYRVCDEMYLSKATLCRCINRYIKLFAERI